MHSPTIRRHGINISNKVSWYPWRLRVIQNHVTWDKRHAVKQIDKGQTITRFKTTAAGRIRRANPNKELATQKWTHLPKATRFKGHIGILKPHRILKLVHQRKNSPHQQWRLYSANNQIETLIFKQENHTASFDSQHATAIYLMKPDGPWKDTGKICDW